MWGPHSLRSRSFVGCAPKVTSKGLSLWVTTDWWCVQAVPVTQVALGPCTTLWAAAHHVLQRLNGPTPDWGPLTGARDPPLPRILIQKIPGIYF